MDPAILTGAATGEEIGDGFPATEDQTPEPQAETGQAPDLPVEEDAPQQQKIDPMQALAELTGTQAEEPSDAAQNEDGLVQSDEELISIPASQHREMMEAFERVSRLIAEGKIPDPQAAAAPESDPASVEESAAAAAVKLTPANDEQGHRSLADIIGPVPDMSISQEDFDEFTVNGDLAKFNAYQNRVAKTLVEFTAQKVLETQHRQSAVMMANMMATTWPVLQTASDFIERYPQLEEQPRLILNAVAAVRAELPNASRRELLAKMEEKMAYAVGAKQKIGQARQIDLRAKGHLSAPTGGIMPPKATDPSSQKGGDPTVQAFDDITNYLSKGGGSHRVFR